MVRSLACTLIESHSHALTPATCVPMYVRVGYFHALFSICPYAAPLRLRCHLRGVGVVAALQDVKRIVGAPRSDLNVTTASGKGRVAGSIQLLQPQAARWVDCTNSTFSVPGDINDIRCPLDTPTVKLATFGVLHVD